MSNNWYCEVESLEEMHQVEGMFKELGGKIRCDNYVRVGIVVFANGSIYSDHKKFLAHYVDTYSVKHISIQQLKDLVVLKRNSIDDATHKIGKRRYYLTTSEFFEFINGQWVNIDEFVGGLSFEEITTSKTEYIAPINGVWRLVDDSEVVEGKLEGAIAVPEDSDTATIDTDGVVYFWNNAKNETYVDGDGWKVCDDKAFTFLKTYIEHDEAEIIWQRDKDCDVKTPNQTTIEAMNDEDDMPVASTHGLSKWFTSNVMPRTSAEDIITTTNDYEDQIISVSSPQEVQIVLNFLSLDGYAVEGVHQCNCPTCPDKPPEVVTHIHTFDDGSVLLSNTDESFVCDDVTKFNDFVYDKI